MSEQQGQVNPNIELRMIAPVAFEVIERLPEGVKRLYVSANGSEAYGVYRSSGGDPEKGDPSNAIANLAFVSGMFLHDSRDS